MDGFFMKKMISNVIICLSIVSTVWIINLITDYNKITKELIRFHVVANSDTEQDQSAKLMVRDAVLNSIQGDLAALADADAAKKYLLENLNKIQGIANQVLIEVGLEENAVVTLCQEAFECRAYGLFSLPAGVYETLKIVIGNGEGQD